MSHSSNASRARSSLCLEMAECSARYSRAASSSSSQSVSIRGTPRFLHQSARAVSNVAITPPLRFPLNPIVCRREDVGLAGVHLALHAANNPIARHSLHHTFKRLDEQGVALNPVLRLTSEPRW